MAPVNEGRPRLGRRIAATLKTPRGRCVALLALAGLTMLCPLLATGTLVHHIYFDRSGLPDLDPFIRFQPPTTGEVYDARGVLLIQLAREYRRVVSYDEVPPILRDAILAAEDKNFFSHSGVDYTALPRVIQTTTSSTLARRTEGDGGPRLRLPQGGSTLTQQLVRGYFLPDVTRRENGTDLLRGGLSPRILGAILGVGATNKLLRKVEEVRLTLWLEEEMGRRYGSQRDGKREIFARYASFIYLGNGRYGYAAASEYYFGRPLSTFTANDAGQAALLAAISKSPRVYAPVAGNAAVLRRRNQILALMARRGTLSPDAARRCQQEPVHVAARGSVKTQAPAAIEHVFDELRRHGADLFGVEDLFQGRIAVHSTVDARVQRIVNEALESGLARYEARHLRSKGLIQGSVIVLRNADAAILAETGGRRVYQDRATRYSDLNRATRSLRQPGSAWKPLVYLTAFQRGVALDTLVPDVPIGVRMGADRPVKWIGNYDNQFKGPIPVRQALAESRNAVAVWLTREIGLHNVIRTARQLGIRSPIRPYITTALGASEVHLLELANVYRSMASARLAEPHIIDRVTDPAGGDLYQAPRSSRSLRSAGLSAEALGRIQEGLRGVIRLPGGTAHSLDGRGFPIAVMGKTGTTSDFRDALFVGSTYGEQGITVAVRIGFDDNRSLGSRETGGRAALPVFREIMIRVYQEGLVGPPPAFPSEIEERIDAYLATPALPAAETMAPPLPSQPAADGR